MERSKSLASHTAIGLEERWRSFSLEGDADTKLILLEETFLLKADLLSDKSTSGILFQLSTTLISFLFRVYSGLSWFKINYFRSVKDKKCSHKCSKHCFSQILKLNTLLLLTVLVPEQFVPWALWWYFNILYWFHTSGVSLELEDLREGEGKAEQKDWFSQPLVFWKLGILQMLYGFSAGTDKKRPCSRQFVFCWSNGAWAIFLHRSRAHYCHWWYGETKLLH